MQSIRPLLASPYQGEAAAKRRVRVQISEMPAIASLNSVAARRSHSLAAPYWFALFQECADAFLRIYRRCVLAHYFFCVVVGLFGVQIDLLVEGSLADSYYERAGFHYLHR